MFPPRPRLNKSRGDSSATKRKMEHKHYEDSDSLNSGSDVYTSPTKKKRTSGETTIGSQQQKQDDQPKSGGNSNFLKNSRVDENNKQRNSAGELSANDKSSSFEEDEGDTEVDDPKINDVPPSTSKSFASTCTSSLSSISSTSESQITKIPMSSTSSIEISKCLESSNSFKDTSSPDMISIKFSPKDLVSENNKEFLLPKNKLLDIDSGCSTAPSSQEFLGFPSQTYEEEEDDETFLKRVESFSENYRENPVMQPTPVHRTESIDLAKHVDENESNFGLCRFCFASPKNGVFVHNNCVHLICCYKCAVKVWKKRKSCPICNGKIKNVTKLFVH